MTMKTLLAGAALAALLIAPAAAQAADGLNGAYYVLGSEPGSIANTEADIAAASGPNATFIATEVCFPSCGASIGDSATLSQFLGGNATNLSNDINGLGSHGVVLTGFLNVASAGTYSLSLGSDDGSELFINGASAIDNDGDHAFNTLTDNVTLNAGANAIEIIQFEDGGSTGLTFGVNNAVATLSTTNGSGGVPEPAAWALMLVGFGGLGAMLRTHRRAVATAA
jgi:hypothetical protein